MTKAADEAERLTRAVRVAMSDLATLNQRVDDLRTTADSALDIAAAARRDVAALAELVRELVTANGAEEQPEEPAEAAPSWLLVDDQDEAVRRMADLIEWLGAVYGRWRDAQLRECWMWHPAAVAELMALRDSWQAAYGGPYPNPAAVMDWLERHRPGVVRRVAVELEGCRLVKHGPGGGEDYRPPRVLATEQADELAAWWASTHGSTAAPPPSPAQLAESRARLETR